MATYTSFGLFSHVELHPCEPKDIWYHRNHNSANPAAAAIAAKPHSAAFTIGAALLGDGLEAEAEPDDDDDETEVPSPVMLAMVVSVAPWRGSVMTPVLFMQSFAKSEELRGVVVSVTSAH